MREFTSSFPTHRMLPLRTLLPTFLLLTGLLLGGCKKDDPQPPQATSSASYVFDGQARTCAATQTTSTAAGYDLLVITLTTTPQPASGPEVLTMSLRKPTGQPASAYAYVPVGSLLLQAGGTTQPYPITHRSPLPTFNGDGSVSGTFEGEVLAMISSGTVTTIHTVKAGTYANVRP